VAAEIIYPPQKAESSAAPSVEPVEQLDPGPPDALLFALVSLANLNEGISMTITLTVPGGVVSGMLIQNERWLREVAQVIADATGDAEGLAGVVRDWHSVLDELDDDLDAGSVTSRPAGYVHLADARVYVGGAGMPNDGTHWRGRLRDVTGWSLGTLGKGAA